MITKNLKTLILSGPKKGGAYMANIISITSLSFFHFGIFPVTGFGGGELPKSLNFRA